MFAFAATIFLSAYLLFFVQPMIARFILPWFGGVPAVWTTCMLFFQLTLLGGYFYADWLNRRFELRWQVWIHTAVALIGLLFLPVIPEENWKPSGEGQPVLRILGLLALTIGWPYFVLSTTGPLLQAWFTRRYPERSPYRLYALSNTGSLLALLGYPFLIEPQLGTRPQAVVWSIAYATFVLLLIGTGWMTAKGARYYRVEREAELLDKKPPQKTVIPGGWWAWLTLSTIPSVLLLAVTNELCQDVAVIPFLWILPLSLYLISFIICFERPTWYQRPLWTSLLFLSTAAVVAELYQPGSQGLIFSLLAFNGCLFSAAMVCHGELALSRPEPARLTRFYLAISLGGALGGVFVVFAAPMLFVRYHELHWSLVAATLVGLLSLLPIGRLAELATAARMTLLGGLMVAIGILSRDLSGFQQQRALQLAFAVCWLAAGAVGINWILRTKTESATAPAAANRALCAAFLLLAGVWSTLGAVPLLLPHLVDWFLPLYLLCLIGLAASLLGSHNCWGNGLPTLDWANGLGLTIVVLVLSGLLWQQARLKPVGLLRESRDFYGLVSAVAEGTSDSPRGILRELFSGRIMHGMQYQGEGQRRHPVSYYGAISGVGQAFANHPRRLARLPLRVGVVGLGAGVLAAWSEAGDELTYFEINPLIRDYAWEFFSYLSDSPARTEVVIGDGRIQLEQRASDSGTSPYHLLVIDAFSGDAIPRHLLTRECFAVYRTLVDPQEGILALHITNGHFALAPVVLALAEEAGWSSLEVISEPKNNLEEVGQEESHWILLSRRAELLEPLRGGRGVSVSTDQRLVWTDDFGSVVQLLKLSLPNWWPETLRPFR